MHGTGVATRSYLYVEDVAEAFDIVLHRGEDGQTYNIGTQDERTVVDVARDVLSEVDEWRGREGKAQSSVRGGGGRGTDREAVSGRVGKEQNTVRVLERGRSFHGLLLAAVLYRWLQMACFR